MIFTKGAALPQTWISLEQASEQKRKNKHKRSLIRVANSNVDQFAFILLFFTDTQALLDHHQGQQHTVQKSINQFLTLN